MRYPGRVLAQGCSTTFVRQGSQQIRAKYFKIIFGDRQVTCRRSDGSDEFPGWRHETERHAVARSNEDAVPARSP
jgi:hypothetical protein